VVTFSALRVLPEIYDQESCFLAGEVGIVEEDYSGLASKEERVRPMAEALRKWHAVIMPNHGALTQGANVQQAVFFMLLLEGMVQRHLAVTVASRATGLVARPIAAEIARATKQELNSLKALPLVWEDVMARLRLSDPGLFSSEPSRDPVSSPVR
jgi:ribulose-5-phosphate 4-epimerase/fuculose-1-phosphate aldolase